VLCALDGDNDDSDSNDDGDGDGDGNGDGDGDGNGDGDGDGDGDGNGDGDGDGDSDSDGNSDSAHSLCKRYFHHNLHLTHISTVHLETTQIWKAHHDSSLTNHQVITILKVVRVVTDSKS
jgi:hypothetical protein